MSEAETLHPSTYANNYGSQLSIVRSAVTVVSCHHFLSMCVWSVSYTVHTIAQLPAPTPAWPLPHLHSADWATLSAGLVCSWYVAHRLKPYSVCAAMHEHTHLPTTTDTLIFHVTSTVHTYLYTTSYNMHVSINVCIYIKLHT